MSKDERYDIVIIGGGPNGMTAEQPIWPSAV